MTTVDVKDLETKVQDMYREVAENPHGEFHFEMGRAPGGAARLPARRAGPDSRGGYGIVRRGWLLLQPREAPAP